MAVIKRDGADQVSQDAIVLDMMDLGRQAEQLKEAARQKAAAIIHEAEQTSARLAEEAHEDALQRGHAEGVTRGLDDGRKQGHEEAMAETRERLEQLQDVWTRTAAEWQERRESLEQQARVDVLRLALRIAEQVVHRVVEVDRRVVGDQLASALAHVLRPLDVTVAIHPEDRAFLEEAVPQLMVKFAHLKDLRLVDDANVSRGGCVLSYGQGGVDASIDTQLERLVSLIVPDPAIEPADEGELTAAPAPSEPEDPQTGT